MKTNAKQKNLEKHNKVLIKTHVRTVFAHSVINFCIFNCFMFPIFTKRNFKDFFTVYTFPLCGIMKLHNSPKEQKLFIFLKKNIKKIYIGEGFLGSY
jgi:hypothetical protein